MADSKKQRDHEDGPLFSAIVVADASPGSHAVPAGPRSIEVKASLARVSDSHQIRWGGELHIRLDCFICRRSGRTTWVQHGADAGTCSGSRNRRGLEQPHEPHPAPVKIASFNTSREGDRSSFRWLLERWWEPFYDVEDERDATPTVPWVRIIIPYRCPQTLAEYEDFTQSNLGWPYAIGCEDCGERLGLWEEAPRVRLLERRGGE